MAVIFAHTQLVGTNHYPHFFQSLINHATFGVQLFYIISAYTICLSLAKYPNSPHFWRDFYLRRFFRLAPLFYLSIIFYFFFLTSANRQVLSFNFPVTVSNILAALTFTNSFSPYYINSLVPGGWAIAIEAIFYLFFPLIFRYFRNFRIILWTSIITAILAQLLNIYLKLHPPIADDRLWADFLYYYYPSQLPVFLLGFGLYYLTRLRRFSRQLISLAQLLLILVLFQLTTGSLFPYHYLFSLLLATLTYFLSLHPAKLLVNNITQYIGKISFSLYLTHTAVLFLMLRFHLVDFISLPLANFAIRYLLLLSLSLIVSTFTYHLIEQPGQRLGKALITRLN